MSTEDNVETIIIDETTDVTVLTALEVSRLSVTQITALTGEQVASLTEAQISAIDLTARPYLKE